MIMLLLFISQLTLLNSALESVCVCYGVIKIIVIIIVIIIKA